MILSDDFGQKRKITKDHFASLGKREGYTKGSRREREKQQGSHSKFQNQNYLFSLF